MDAADRKTDGDGRTKPIVIAIGGGKGGTGKSTVALSLAVQMALSGSNVILADLDFGAANLHTMLEMQTTRGSLVQFLYQPKIFPDLHDCLSPTDLPDLLLLPGDGFMPGIANMEFAKKQKLIRGLKNLGSDYVVCDLGAGSNYNVVDFFLAADINILVFTAEPTAILNGYEFLKNCIFRKTIRYFAKNREVIDLVSSYKNSWENGTGGSVGNMITKIQAVFPEAANSIRKLCDGFTPVMLLNKENADNNHLGHKLNELSRKYLNVSIDYLGALPPEPALRRKILAFMKSGSCSSFKLKLGAIATSLEQRFNRHYKPDIQ